MDITTQDKGHTETLSIDGIGLKAGFTTRSNFYSSFKAVTGVTPSEYLENRQKVYINTELSTSLPVHRVSIDFKN